MLAAAGSVLALVAGTVGLLGGTAAGSAGPRDALLPTAGLSAKVTAHSSAVAEAVYAARQQRVSTVGERRVSRSTERGATPQLASILSSPPPPPAPASIAVHAKELAARDAQVADPPRPIWVLPVTHFVLTARFGQVSPLWGTFHTGQDFAAPWGTPVHAIGAGVIVFAGWDGPYGNKLVIRHPDGTESWYCHLSSFVHTSGSVSVGELIARVGATGNATGPHLHLEIHPGGGPAVDPLPWLRAHGVNV